MLLANRLTLPDDTAALLFDMDGVLLDTLSFDYAICNQLLQSHAGPDAKVTRAQIKAFFPFDLPGFWTRILDASGVVLDSDRKRTLVAKLSEAHQASRESTQFQLNPGVEQILGAAPERGLKLAVISNNPTQQVREMLRRSQLLERFDAVFGNDLPNMAKKPAPDPYLRAAESLGLPPARCVVIEDSLLGAESGRRAGCFTVGVATGAATFEELEHSDLVDRAYSAFEEEIVELRSGHVTQKQIITPNDFVSHMIEHIAWRLGVSINLHWHNSDWRSLGRAVGAALSRFERSSDSAAVLGMIDDGSVEARITSVANEAQAGVNIEGTSQVDIEWFLGLRCEQIKSGKPLVELLEGIAGGLPARVDVTVCNMEDPHHSWEGVFRSIGIGLSRVLEVGQPASLPQRARDAQPAEQKHWEIDCQSGQRAQVVRRTAESEVRVLMDFTKYAPPKCHFVVSESIHVDGLTELLELLCEKAGIRLELDFKATRLSSSHVVMEDVGMVMGRTLQEIMVKRMAESGINGAGSSLTSIDGFGAPVHVGLSVEGRKFWTFVPMETSFDDLRREFLVGHDVGRGLFTEDLDDFIDGFSGGLGGSVVIHVRGPVSPREGWPLIFQCLGSAIAEALRPNPSRKGVPPGVKATLA